MAKNITWDEGLRSLADIDPWACQQAFPDCLKEVVMHSLVSAKLDHRHKAAFEKVFWALSGALLFKVCYLGLFKGEHRLCNAGYLAGAFGAAGGAYYFGSKASVREQAIGLYERMRDRESPPPTGLVNSWLQKCRFEAEAILHSGS